jgi:hypothetical protein
MPGPAPKPAADRQRSNHTDLGLVYRPDQIPDPPSKLCVAAKEAWTAYWSDVVAGAVRISDTSLVKRWISNVDRYLRLMRMADQEPVVAGSTGQPKTNSLYDLAFKIEASIKVDEAQLGIGPLNRLRLGVKLAEGAKSLADLTEGEDDDDGDFDPRLALVRPS